MLKRTLPITGVLALMTAFVIGCSDAPVTSPQANSATSLSSDAYAVYPVTLDISNIDDLRSIDAIANDPSLLTPPPDGPGDKGRGGDTTHRGGGDTTKRGGGGDNGGGRGGDTTKRGGGDKGDDSLHRGGRGRGDDTTKHRGDDTTKRGGDTAKRGDDGPRGPKVDLGRIFAQLQLTDAQAIDIRQCVAELNDCLRSTEARFRAARQDLRSGLQSDIDGIKQAVRSGRITAEEGRRLIKAKIEEFRAAAADLEARFKRATNECWTEFDRCVRSHLTPEQIARWERLFHH